MQTIFIISLCILSAFSWYAWYSILNKYNKLKNLYQSLEVNKATEIEILKEDLESAKNLKNVLEILATKTGIPTPATKGGYLYAVDNGFGVSSTSWNTKIVLPDTVLQYTEDILGGKVIKQEGNKCLVIAKDGTVKTGLTKAKVDKGYTYKLVRE